MSNPTFAKTIKGKGRHYLFPDDAFQYPSITNIIGNMDKPAIPRWASKLAAEYAVEHKWALGALPDKDAIKLIKGAPWDSRDEAADFGSDVHEFIENSIDLLPAHPAYGFVSAAGEAMEYLKHEVWKAEVTLVNTVEGYAGTADVLANDGAVVSDYKTGSGPWESHALQLTALMHCDQMVADDGEWLDAPNMLEAFAIMLRSDHWEAYGFERDSDQDQGAFKAFLGLLNVQSWEHRKGPWQTTEPTFKGKRR